MERREYVWIHCANDVCKQIIPVPFIETMEQTQCRTCGVVMNIRIGEKNSPDDVDDRS